MKEGGKINKYSNTGDNKIMKQKGFSVWDRHYQEGRSLTMDVSLDRAYHYVGRQARIVLTCQLLKLRSMFQQ